MLVDPKQRRPPAPAPAIALSSDARPVLSITPPERNISRSQHRMDSSHSPSAGGREAAAERDAASAEHPGSASTSSSGSKPRPPQQRSPSASSINLSSHRQSFAENLRNGPSSPRHRHPSFTQAAVQELMNHPPTNKHANPKFAGRNWQEISAGELVSLEDIRWVELDSSVEEATKLLLTSPTNVVLVRENAASNAAVSCFDYSDLNTYLLIVVGLSKPEPHQFALFNDIISKAQQGMNISLREAQSVFGREALVKLESATPLSQAIEALGSGMHRLVVTGQDGAAEGVMSQLRLADFFWNEGVNFPAIDRLYPVILRDLGVGTHHAISVNSDSALSDALMLMNEEGLTSVAVVDNGQNVVGNISTKDVRHLTSTSSAPLLSASCMHFISVILNERGVEKGRDAFPVFYVNPYSTLAHTVAKLVATRSHRMWVVESASPSPSAPATPLLGPQSLVSGSSAPGNAPPSPVPAAAVPASAMAGARLSGKLTGVVSLTDVLNMFAKSTGLHPGDPGEQRARRRRSSSSSVRPSMDSIRLSADHRR